jgi:hypothetical protein
MTTDLRLPLIVVGLLGITASLRIATGPIARVELPRSPVDAPTAHFSSTGGRIATESIATIVSRDPFRIGRRPLLPAYDPLRLAEQLAPSPPKPTLSLVGVLNGIEPSAVIEGLPGVEGSRVVRVGDIVAGLTVKKITNGRVVIAGMDTTWVLEVREPWKN